MGRIALYERSKLKSTAIYQPVTNPYAQVAEEVGRDISRTAMAFQERADTLDKDKQLAAKIEGDNAFADYAAAYATAKAELSTQANDAKSEQVDTFYDKMVGARTALASRYQEGLSAEGKQQFSKNIASFEKRDGAQLGQWKVKQKYKNLENDVMATAYANAGTAEKASSADGFALAMATVDQSLADYANLSTTDPKKVESFSSRVKTKAVRAHKAYRLDKDPGVFADEIKAGKYGSLYSNEDVKKAEAAYQTQQASAVFGASLDQFNAYRNLMTAYANGSLSLADIEADNVFSQEGTPYKNLISALSEREATPQKIKGDPDVQLRNLTKLTQKAKALNLKPNANAEKLAKAWMLSEEAMQMLKREELSPAGAKYLTDILSLRKAPNAEKFAKNKAKTFARPKAFEKLYKSEDDPLEYITYRALADTAKLAKAKGYDAAKTEKLQGHAITLINKAMSGQYGDDQSYEQLTEQFLQNKDTVYRSFIDAVEDNGRYIGYDILRRSVAAAEGAVYSPVTKVGGKDRKVVAHINGRAYVSMDKEDLDKLTRSRKL